MPEHDFVLTTLYSTPGVPFTYCPRWALQRQLEVLDKEFGLSFRVGFEAEFYLLKSVPSGKPEDETKLVGVDTSLYCSSTAFNSLAPILSEVTSALKSLGIPIEQLHAESGKGQYEISMLYAPALKSADNLLLLRETITAIAQKHDLTATFLPKYSKFDAGSGGHVHMSLWDGATSAMASADEDGMSPVARHFFAGVLEHLPALLAFTTPHPNSYFRMQPNCWAGVHRVWGVQNREAPLRVIPFVGKSEVSNIELKAIDGCANPYLALAAILTAGMDGLRRKTPLPPPTEVNPNSLENESELRLPSTLGAAVTALESDASVFRNALGSDLIDCVIALRKAEDAHFSDESLSFEAAVKSLIGKF